MNQEQPSSGEPLVGEVRFRVPLPVVIPIAALVVIGALAIGMSRILLALPKEAAVVVAIATAANVLGVAGFLAYRRHVSATTFMELGAIVVYPLLIGVVIAALNIGEGTGHAAGGNGEEPAGGNGGNGGGITVVAANIAFDVTEIVVPAAEEVPIHFDNQDSVEHNISVYPDQDSGIGQTDGIFTGDIIQGGETTDYAVPPVDAGTYYFQCDVHPNMNGDYIAE